MILAVDDESLVLKSLVRELEIVFPGKEIVSFSSGNKAKEFIKAEKNEPIEYAFLDIRLRGTTGLEIAKFLKEHSPNSKVVFCTAYSDYTMDAWKLHALGYLIKPVTATAIKETLDAMDAGWDGTVETPLNKLKVQTFGNFEVFLDGKVVMFDREKSKELFAYLVDRNGATVSNADIASALWEEDPFDDSKKAYVRKLISSLHKTLKDVGAEDVLVRDVNRTAIDVSKVSCDLYDFLNGDAVSVNSYRGEYMINYPWAEFSYSYFMD